MTMLRQAGLALTVAAFAIPMMATPAAAKQHQGLYLGGAGGITMPTNSDARFAGSENSLEYDIGPAVTFSVGYAWGNGLRSELEFGWRGASIDAITGPGSGPLSTGDMEVFTGMFNEYYDIDLGTWVTPYIGAGIGYAELKAHNIQNAINGSRIDGDEGVFAYQGIAGVGFDLDDNWTLTADYRYLTGFDTTFETQTPTVGSKTEYASHNVMFGVRYTWGEETKPVPVAQPAPPPPPAPVKPVAKPAVPPVPQTYMVFFDFDRTDLTPEAQRILASVANDFKGGKPVRVHVTGHADRSGTNKYNMNLSLKRAGVVKAELDRLGVPTEMIFTKGAGEEEPMIPTADGVREAQNRRAEIFLGDIAMQR